MESSAGRGKSKRQQRRERRLTIDIRQIQGEYTPEAAWQRGWQTAIPFVCSFSFHRAYTPSLRSDMPQFSIQNEVGIRQWIIVDEIVQF